MKHTVQPFGVMPDGTRIHAHTLENGAGMSVTLLEYGAILQRITLPDRAGSPVNVVLGQDTLAAYLQGAPFSGAVIGRVANRIGGAAFTLDGAVWQLEKNAGDLNIHSGSGRYGWRAFSAEDASDDRHAAVMLRLTDRGEGGMPGTVDFSVCFSLNEQNELTLSYQAIPSQKTPISVTDHAYFNLCGDQSDSVAEHLFQINADFYLPNAADGLPTGEVLAVADTRFDFNAPASLYGRLLPDGRGFDNNYCLRGRGMRSAGAAFAASTGIRLRVATDMPGMQFFTPKRAFCFETQHFPNAVNVSHFPSNLYTPDAPMRSRTVFAFDVPDFGDRMPANLLAD